MNKDTILIILMILLAWLACTGILALTVIAIAWN